MCRKSICLLSALFVLSVVCTSSGLVISDFEGNMDGWFVNNWDTPPGTISLSTVGVTSGSQSLKIEAPRPNSWQIAALVKFSHSTDAHLYDQATFLPIYLANTTIEMDITFDPADWPNPAEGAAAFVETVVNSQIGGWQGQGRPDTDDVNPIVTGGWDPVSFPAVQTRHITWDISDTHDALANGGGDWFELFIIITTGADGSFPNGGAIYIDNVQLTGAPETTPAKIVWVSEWNSTAEGVPYDQGWIDLLRAQGYVVDANTAGNFTVLTEGKTAELESADLIIVSRNSNSGGYATDVNEITQWNSFKTPLVLMTAYNARSNRWQWINGTTIVELAPETIMDVVDTSHPVFAGVTIEAIDSLNIVDVIDEAVDLGQNTFITATDVGNGKLLARRLDDGSIWLAEWTADVNFYEGTEQVPAGKRMLFSAGGGGGQMAGSMNLNADGQKMFLNAVAYMLTELAPAGPVHSYTFEDGTANDSIGDADGVVVGDAYIADGALITVDQDDWMEMPGDIIAMSTYSEVTIEAWYTPEAGGNTSWSMLAYFGDSVNGLGSNGYFITSARGDDKSRAAISCGDIATPWASESGADGPEYDDGLLHHMVSTLNATDITLYIDGVLIASTPLSATNSISCISPNLAYLAKGGYEGDPEWIGTMEEFNIYNRALSEAEIAALFAAGPKK